MTYKKKDKTKKIKQIKPKQNQEKESQKQSQKQTITVNVGTVDKSKSKKSYKPRQPKQNSVNQISMFTPPSIYTYPPQFRETETAPKVAMPSRTTRNEYVPFAEQPIRRPREFFTETSTVEFLPNDIPNTEEVVNEYTDDPVQINAGIIDEFNPVTDTTEYHQTQNPELSMTIYNPVQDNQIDDEYNKQVPNNLNMIVSEVNNRKQREYEKLNKYYDNLGFTEKRLKLLMKRYDEENMILNNYDRNNQISTDMIVRPRNDNRIDYFKDIPKSFSNKKMPDEEEQIPDEEEQIPNMNFKYINDKNMKKLPIKNNGSLALSGKSYIELSKIAKILGVKTKKNNGIIKIKPILKDELQENWYLRNIQN